MEKIDSTNLVYNPMQVLHFQNIVDIYINYIKRIVEILEDALKKANPEK